MKRNFAPILLSLFILPSFFTTAMAGSGGGSVFDRWFGESTDYPLVYEQYLHQLRVAEGEFRGISQGKEVSRSRLDALLQQIQTCSVLLDNASEGHRDLPDNVLLRYRTEKRKIQHHLKTLVEAHEKTSEWHRLIHAMKTNAYALLQASDKFAVDVARKEKEVETVYIVSRQLVLLQRLIANLNWLSFSSGTEEDVMATDRIGRDIALFSRVIKGLQSGDHRLGLTAMNDASLQKQLESLSTTTKSGITDKVNPLLELAPEIFKYKMDLAELSHSIERLEPEIKTVN